MADTTALLRARRRYDILRTLLMGLLAAVVLVSLLLLILQGRESVRQGHRIEALVKSNAAQGAEIADLLARRKAADARRQYDIDTTLNRIFVEQRRELVVHDRSVKRYLSQIQVLSRSEVRGGRSQHRP